MKKISEMDKTDKLRLTNTIYLIGIVLLIGCIMLLSYRGERILQDTWKQCNDYYQGDNNYFHIDGINYPAIIGNTTVVTIDEFTEVD